MADPNQLPAEVVRLLEDSRREQFWKLWGPYVSERQWGTVREDYSADGDVWKSFTHDDARSRAYRWGEDGLLGWTDRFCRLCFSIALWNGRDSILKERLFGLTGPQGNHGEDVKELYYYLDSTPTHSYAKSLYKYPQAAYPYEELVAQNAGRSRELPEYELLDTGVFNDNAYFDVVAEYAKASIQDTLIRITIHNRGKHDASLHVLPQLTFRNTWSWGDIKEEATSRPLIKEFASDRLHLKHATMGEYLFAAAPSSSGVIPEFLFTENETNSEKLFHSPNRQPYVKDAFHRRVVDGETNAVNPAQHGTKAAAWYRLEIPAGESVTLHLRLVDQCEELANFFGDEYADTFDRRIHEANEFYDSRLHPDLNNEQRLIARSAYSGLLWSKQFYNLVQVEWANGDPGQIAPPPGHAIRNEDWVNLFNRDVVSMPDKWEYPYYCTWDLAFHAVSLSHVDPPFAKQQLILFLREWYMHPNGQIPAYEWNFSDVNPPVHAWAAWRIYRLPWLDQKKDLKFLESVFQKLLLNFTWWVNRKDPDDNNLFAGGFLGLDNIGVFDRSKPLPTGGTLKQADGTAWMAFYCIHMLSIATELAQADKVYEDLASKFFEHFVRIVHAMNDFCGTGLWNEEDGFYYDMLQLDDQHVPLKVRSIVGFMPLIAATIMPAKYIDSMPEFKNRMEWFIRNYTILSEHTKENNPDLTSPNRLLAVTTRKQLERIFRYMFDEEEFLSPFGIRSVSKFHEKNPYTYWANGVPYSVDYEPGEGTTGMFGGNSNWRGPIWFPINFLLVEALRVYGKFYGDDFKVEFPTRSGNHLTLTEAADRISERLISLFQADAGGHRPCHGGEARYATDQNWKDLILFNEYYHAETGRGCGASHQTGWTALVSDLLTIRKKVDCSG